MLKAKFGKLVPVSQKRLVGRSFTQKKITCKKLKEFVSDQEAHYDMDGVSYMQDRIYIASDTVGVFFNGKRV